VTGDVSQSPGFHVIYLPFANDVRAPQIEPVGPDARMRADAVSLSTMQTPRIVWFCSWAQVVILYAPQGLASIAGHILPLMTRYAVLVVSFLVLILSERQGCRDGRGGD
jgi:hypothetical protein